MQLREGCECSAAPAGVPRQLSQSLLERVWQLGSVRNEAGRLARATVGRTSRGKIWTQIDQHLF